MEKEQLVSIIIPVYNAAKSLPLCLQSLANQTYSNIELIVVDDCSTDDSLAVVKQFAAEWESDKHMVKLCRHEKNQGVAAARNTGLDCATGDYVYFMDADDFIERETIRQMSWELSFYKVDIVGTDWFLTFKHNERYMQQPVFSTPEEAIALMMYGRMRWNLWLFMVRRSLYEENHIRFVPGDNMGEDMMVVLKLFAKARKVSYVMRPFYHYLQLNEHSITKEYGAHHREQVTRNVAEVERFFKACGEERYLKYMPFLKLNIKLPLLVNGRRSDLELWQQWFAEANAYVMKNPALSLRTRLLQYCAAKKWYSVVLLYHTLVWRLVYGVIYR